MHIILIYTTVIPNTFTKIFLTFIFERERETEHQWGRGRERGEQNLKQAPGSVNCEHRAPDTRLELTDREIVT